MNISVVIPTRNRLDSLNRTLHSISNQTCIPKEIIIVDSSDIPIQNNQLTSKFSSTSLQIINTKPSVCLQRNIGIAKSSSEYIFLCDDDLVYDESYIQVLFQYLNENPSIQMVSGLVLEKEGSAWRFGHKISNLNLVYKLFFGLSIFSDLSSKKDSNKFIKYIVKKALSKGNHISKAGWPHFIDMSKEEILFPFFSLMATLIRKPSDDLFDPVFIYNGIGDNYDACLKLGFNITILKKVKAYHHRENINRIDSGKGFFYRTSALHYIIKKHQMFNWKNRVYLIWSLVGVLIPNVIKIRVKNTKMILTLIRDIITNQTIYDKANIK